MVRISSALNAIEFVQSPPPLIIGERLNTQGSKLAKKYVLSNNFDGLIDIARTQVNDGAHCLDVCVAITERSNEMEFMTKLVKQLGLEIAAPLVIDSTDPNVIISTIQQIPGKPIINSINLEGNADKFHKLAPIMVKYGVPAIALCIGPNGMAKSPSEKLDTATLLYETGNKYGLKPEQYIFDVLTFTLSTGQKEFINAGKNTLDGIKLVKKKFPTSFTTLGLSNISFGLNPQARKIINSVFLYHAIKAGLDSVIMCARDMLSYAEINNTEKQLAEDLIFNKNKNALSNVIKHFDTQTHISTTNKVNDSWSSGKRLNFKIINRLNKDLENDVIHAILEKTSYDDSIAIEKNNRYEITLKNQIIHNAALQTLNEDLLPAMKEVGDKFGSGELILPFVLKSAECMKIAVTELEKHLIKKENISKGKIVLGTVYGDVHDIGKNLVKTIFENNGYSVYDLGKQVPLQKFIEKINEVQPDAVGLSALLVSTSKQMQIFVEYVKKHKLSISILCGGAAINSNYINRIAKENTIYDPGIFYCNTMFDGLKTMDSLTSPSKNIFIKKWRTKIEKWKDVSENAKQINARSKIKPVSPPTPTTIDLPIRLNIDQIDIKKVLDFINKKSLFVLSWGLRGKSSKSMLDKYEKLLSEWKNRILHDKLIDPQAVYGYFKCHAHNNKLVVEHEGNEFVFSFPRSSKSKHLCIADFFGQDDIVAFQSVTAGHKVSKIIEKWNNEYKYTDAYYLHGFAVEVVEAMAEWLHLKIKTELKIDHGLRYSWGYPSCPDVLQHKIVWKLLKPEKSGMTLTGLGQIVPDHSTAAIIVHHPEAEYFVL
ncbi:MAG: dihydropteroate synthase [Nitrosopumilaceae archaeon]|nr:dihydropteroate synthase [Nitrosopumilaceae archaeon]